MGAQTLPANAVELDGVSCRLGRHTILDGITLRVQAGRITGLLGQNGAGKSTLLNLLTGLRPVSGGRAWLLGERLPARAAALRRRVGIVFQETALYEELTAYENLRFTSSLFAVPSPHRRVVDVLELLRLEGRMHDRVGILSGGMRRRIAIARALLHRPELLVIDEPTLGVDADARHDIWSHIRLLRSRGTTVIVATNYLDEAEALCDSVAVLRHGRLVAHETPQTLIARTGRCIDVDCHPGDVELIGGAIADLAGVLRIDATASGAAVFLDGAAPTERVLESLLRTRSVGGFRLRAADLAEVFRALG